MIKIMTIMGTRPEIIRLSRIINSLDKQCNQKLVYTGQNFNFELSEIFFEQLKIRKPDFLFKGSEETSLQTISRIMLKTNEILITEKPDAVLILGDTNSCLAAAIASKRHKTPIFHMEAGNRCYDQRVPEEINRKVIDHISDINLTYSNIAKENLLRENFPPDQIIKIGSPLKEVLDYYMPQIQSQKILNQLKLTENQFFLVSAHREENINSERLLKKLEVALNTVANKFNLPIILSTHPRTQKEINKKKIKFHSLVQTVKPLGFLDYVCLQMNARCVLSDSGSITEESSILNFRALNIRETHERHEGMEEGSVIMVGLNVERICQALHILKNQSKGKDRSIKIVNDYNVSNVSEKVPRIIYSYIDYINRVIWKKS
jgi:UDP-N-acetylglucosamine 2-epimerase (non-hydrolysing)